MSTPLYPRAHDSGGWAYKNRKRLEELERIRASVRLARENREWWDHFILFYDNFFNSVSPSYKCTIAALKAMGAISQSDMEALKVHSPDDAKAAAEGTIAGMIFSFWLGSGWEGGAQVFKVGTKTLFWSPTGNISQLAIRGKQVSHEYGLLTIFVKSGNFEKIIELNNAMVFALPKFLLTQGCVWESNQ
jgi:hypothetical protein